MNFSDLSSLATVHPFYLAGGGLVVAVILFLLLKGVFGYFTEEHRILRKLSGGHGVIYRFFRLEILTLVVFLALGGAYEYFTFPNEKWGFMGVHPGAPQGAGSFFKWEAARAIYWAGYLVTGRAAPVEYAFERGGDFVVLHAVPAIMIVAASTFLALAFLDRATAKRAPATALSQQQNPQQIMIGDVPFPWSRWTGHLLIPGTTRAGKSTALASAIHIACCGGIPGLVLDNGGDFLSKFYHPQTDFILNPNDVRTAIIAFFNELRRPQDIERLAFNLVPDGSSEASKYFNGKSRRLFIAIGEALWACGHLTNGDFCRVLKDEAALKKLLAGTEWDAVIANAKSWGDIYSTAVDFFSIFNKLPPQAGLKKIALSADGKAWEIERVGISIREIVERMGRGAPHKVFAPYEDADTSSAGNFLSMVASVFLDAVMSLPPDQNRRIICVVDELGELPEISKLQTALSKSGKYGLSVWLGIQNVSQLRQKYGADGAKVLLGNCNSQLILRLPDPESSTWAADLIGKRYKTVTSTSQSSGDHSSSNESRREELRHQLLPADIQHLPDLEGVLIYFGTRLVKRVNLRRQEFPEIHARHIDLPASAWRPSGGQAPKKPGPPTDENPQGDDGSAGPGTPPISL